MLFDDLPIKQNDYLILYPSGYGGEFIAHAISSCSGLINTLPITHTDELRNRYQVHSKINYSEVSYVTNNWHSGYEGEDDNNKRNIYKDHFYDPYTMWMYENHLSDMNIVILHSDNPETWATLCWNKLSYKIINPGLAVNLEAAGVYGFTDNHLEMFSKHKWLYRHDVFNAIKYNKVTKTGKKRFIKYLVTGINKIDIKKFTAGSKSVSILNIDHIISNPSIFAHLVSRIFPETNTKELTVMMQEWNDKNNYG